MALAAKVQVGPAKIGMGLFAARSLSAGEEIMRLDGRVVHHTVLWRRRGSVFSANCIRFGAETYLDPGEGAGRYINHSCAPNAFLEKRGRWLYLVAARRIGVGSELSFDYSTTIGDDDIWQMRCRCGQARCRGTIRNFGTLPERLRKRYLMKGLVPGYIINTLD
ncbi:MAG: SET domain-containing protein-lysine N-methyltransferase [Gemmatimonadaceae bacterium]